MPPAALGSPHGHLPASCCHHTPSPGGRRPHKESLSASQASALARSACLELRAVPRLGPPRLLLCGSPAPGSLPCPRGFQVWPQGPGVGSEPVGAARAGTVLSLGHGGGTPDSVLLQRNRVFSCLVPARGLDASRVPWPSRAAGTQRPPCGAPGQARSPSVCKDREGVSVQSRP